MSKALDQLKQIEQTRTEPSDGQIAEQSTVSISDFESAVLAKLLKREVKSPDSAFRKAIVFEGKHARFLTKYFPGRNGKALEFIKNAIENYWIASGVTVDDNGTIINPNQVVLSLDKTED